MLRNTLRMIAGCVLAAHLAGGLSAQATFVAYQGPADPILGPDFNVGTTGGAGDVVADDLQIDTLLANAMGGPTRRLASFDFWVRANPDPLAPSPPSTAEVEVKLYAGLGCFPPGPALATFQVSDIPVGSGFRELTVDLPAPLVLPGDDLWMSVTLLTADVKGGFAGYGLTAGNDGTPVIGTSDDDFYWVSQGGCRDSKDFTTDSLHFNFSTTLRLLKTGVVPVQIDIKPGTFPNTVNLGSKGVTQVAILSSVGFDATTVDPLSVTLADAVVRVKGNGTPQVTYQDVNGDGLQDIVLHMETEGLSLTNGDVAAPLEGTAMSDTIYGVDSVRVVP